MLITRILKKLIQDVQQTKKSYYTQVERACNSALQDIRTVDPEDENDSKVLRQRSLEYDQSEDSHGASDNLDLLGGEEVRPQASVDSEKFFIPFELACKGDVAKITVTALDGIQKLVAYGEIIGDYPDPKTPTRRLVDRIVDTICCCHTGPECDEGVELQIIKALLTIVTSEHVQVHESTLLLILRTCCIIHLTTKSVVNQRTARAMLTQMLHSIFHRMEITAEELELQLKNGANRNGHSNEEFTDFQVSCDFASPITCVKNYQNASSPELSRDINQNSENFPEKMCHDDEHESDTLEGTEHHQNGCAQDEDRISEDMQETIRSSPEDLLNPFLNSSSKSFCFSSSNNLINVLQKDAFLSFWTLTKLAVKPLAKVATEAENDKNAADNKFQQAILAFHLLKEVLEKSGRVFKDSPIFFNAMRQHLFHALMQNGISASPEIFKLEVEIFVILLTKFNDILIDEIQDLLETLIFPILDLPNPHPADYNKILLQCLNKISGNLDCFVHFYMTYDYNAEIEARPFQRIVLCLSKIIREKLGNEQLAVEIITNLLKSMSAACPKLNENNQNNMEKLQSEHTIEGQIFEDDTIKNLELEGKDFLTCLHIFLASIEIPCNVLKLDWCVQKMAQKIMDTSSVNSSRTETADCWYSLIYASMSLIADIKITNCQGKSKMSRSQFIKLNRAINGCEPLEETCLSSIYDEIEDNYKRDHVGDSATASDQIKWLTLVEKSEKEILDVIKYILESTSLLRSHFSLGKQLKHVKRMIKTCGTSFLMALISALQSTNDTKLSDVCLDGIHSGIRVACILGLDNERETFVQSLAKLSIIALDEIRGKNISSKVVTKTTSTLTMTENGVTKTVVTTTTEMKCRSVDIILTLLDVGIAEGNHLGGSWLHILKFISQLLSTSLLAESRNSSRSSSPIPPTQTVGGTGSNGPTGWAAWAGSLRESLEKKLWDPNAKALHPSVKESIASSVEKVFKRSEMLTGDAMTEFFQALCQVSLHDMMNSEAPKHLMYEKINEVADGNFYRPALQWSQIWQVVADYFCHLACSSKEEISSLAIDSIQKLVLKLLKKETMSGYRFQNHYLYPFKVIITNTRSLSTREAVLGFVETVISSHGELLLSGWIAIFSILVANMLSHNNDKDAASDSFRALQHIVDKCQKGEVNLRNSYGSIVKSLIEIASNIAPTLEMSEQAFRLLTQLAEIPFQQPQLLMEENDDRLYRVWTRGWKPILCELSEIIVGNANANFNTYAADNHVSINNNGNKISHYWDIKTKGLITLFEVIKSYGSAFEKEWWNSVFEILFNIFNCIKSHEKQDMLATAQLLPSSSCESPPPSTSDGSYKYFYCYYYVQFAIFDVYIQYYDATSAYVFDELLKHLQWCICQDHEQIALSGVSCLQQLVVVLGKRFSVNQWDSILNVFQTICKPGEFSTFPQNGDNLEYQNNDELPQPPAIRAVIHLELLKIMDKVIFPGRKSSLASSPENLEVPSAEMDDITNSKEINSLLTNNQVSVILEILSRSHEISKEQCVMACSQANDPDNESSRQETNFIPHETLSLHIYWKVLFALFKTDSPQLQYGITKDAVWEMILQSCVRSCGYFVTIQTHEHRDAWADLLSIALSNILRLPKPNFETITANLYPYFCEMMELDSLDGKICDKLREYLLVVGRDFGIVSLCNISDDTKQSALSFAKDSAYDSSIPKTCNSGAQTQFQRTCITETVNEGFITKSKDFQ